MTNGPQLFAVPSSYLKPNLENLMSNTNLTTGYKTAAGTTVTPKGRMSYAQYILKPSDKKTKKGDDKYQLTMLYPPESDLTLLKNDAKELVAKDFANFPEHKKASLKSPFLDAYQKTGDERFKGWTMLRLSTKTKPAIVDARNNPVSDESEVYSGRWAQVSVRAGSYGTEQGAESWGVSFFLSNVMLLDHDESLGGGRVNPENEFAPVADAPAPKAEGSGAGGLFD